MKKQEVEQSALRIEHQAITEGTDTLTKPLRFRPFLRPMVWGGRSLGTALGKILASDDAYGEAWEISDHPVHRSSVASGPLAGTTVRELMERRRNDLLGPAAAAHTTFPWLFKFLDACDWLSVQVHPDEKSVKELWPGEGSKTEAWFVLSAEPGSKIYAGLKPGIGPKELGEALANGKAAECLASFTPQPGDCVFLPAGTVHAVGGGVLFAEIQQTSDATFRLYDWDRRDANGQSRTLHIEKGLASIDWKHGPIAPVRVTPGTGAGLHRQELVRCPYFILEHLESKERFTVGGTGKLQVLTILQGKGRLGEEEIKPGQVWLLPACLMSLGVRPQASMTALLATLP